MAVKQLMLAARAGILAVLVQLVACSFVSAGDGFVWVEGEKAVKHNMKRHNWYDSVKKGELSGNDWLSHFAAGEAPEATYNVDIAKGGEYTFWVRANPVADPKLSYQIDGDGWKEINLGNNVDRINIASNGAPDMRYVAWIKVGAVTLKSGKRLFQFKMHSGNNNHGGLDCFVLTQKPFTPSGSLKPGEKLGLADPGKWAFEPDVDSFDSASLLDLSYLNEKPAGKNGFIKLSSDGEDFVDGAGKKIRFWSVNTYVQRKPGMDALRQHAKWLAKRGVNMVRFHGHVPPGKGSKITDSNESNIDECWRMVAAMKEEGIYSTVSPYWGSHTNKEASWGLDHIQNENLAAVVFWDEKVQEAYKAWLKALFARKNKYTGIPLGQDPAVAIIQYQNEDSILFWTMQRVKGQVRRDLGKKFGDWLMEKYGSLDKAFAAWGGNPGDKDDDIGNGVLGLYIIWELTQPHKGAKAKRLDDQLEFYSRLMYDFNTRMAKYLRDELGCKQIINAGNWRTADPVKMGDCERWSYTANEVVGMNKYYGGGAHINTREGHKAGYLISKGDFFESKSACKNPRGMPTNMKQVVGHTHIIPESCWVPPMKYQSEAPFLVAVYSSLSGVDSLYWFCTGDTEWGRPFGKWQINTPSQIGMFPAAALMFREEYIKPAEVVVHEERALKDLWERRSPIIAEDGAFDPNRDSGDIAKESNVKNGVDPYAFLVGRVEVKYDGDPSKSKVIDLKPYIDHDKKIVKSVTGEIVMDYGKGVCTLNSPKAQGATGFLDSMGEIKLGSVKIDSKNEYASILIVSLDGQPISDSKKLLVQVGTICRPYGFKTRETDFKGSNGKGNYHGEEIIDLGASPWNIDNTQIKLAIRNKGLKSAVQIDANGMPIKTVNSQSGTATFKVDLPEDCMYMIIK